MDTDDKASPYFVKELPNAGVGCDSKAMLTGKELGEAIRTAIELKGVTQREVARDFGVKPPSVQDWMKKGTIGKEKLPGLWDYFKDVVGAAHWGLKAFPDASKGNTPHLPGFEELSIPLMAQKGSMGPGSDVLHQEVVRKRINVSPEWALRHVKPSSLENLRMIHGYGDSMAPTFSDGDILLFDLGNTDTSIDGVFVLEADDRIYIKRVTQKFGGSHEVTSDNPAVKTTNVLDGSHQVTVHGRVVWCWNGKKM